MTMKDLTLLIKDCPEANPAFGQSYEKLSVSQGYVMVFIGADKLRFTLKIPF